MDFPRRPLLSDGTLSKLEEILEPRFRVLEQGSGGSTIWLAERVAFLLSFDRNQDWVDATNLELNNLDLRNKARSIYVAGMDPEPIELAGPEPIDLVLVDGQISDRTPFALAAMQVIKPGGWLVVDNTLPTDIKPYNLWPILEATHDWSAEFTFGYIETRPNFCTFWQKPT